MKEFNNMEELYDEMLKAKKEMEDKLTFFKTMRNVMAYAFEFGDDIVTPDAKKEIKLELEELNMKIEIIETIISIGDMIIDMNNSIKGLEEGSDYNDMDKS